MHIVRIGGVSTEQHSADAIGNKAANLARMAALGLPVPPAFVLPVKLCAAIIEKNPHAEHDLRDGLKEGMSSWKAPPASASATAGSRCWYRFARARRGRCRACWTRCSMSAARRSPCKV